jgi:hypothetical protein
MLLRKQRTEHHVTLVMRRLKSAIDLNVNGLGNKRGLTHSERLSRRKFSSLKQQSWKESSTIFTQGLPGLMK